MSRKIDERGNYYGRLYVLGETRIFDRELGTRLAWLCLCDCGNYTSVTGSKLRSGNTTSCGCYHRERVSQNQKKWTYRANAKGIIKKISESKKIDETGKRYGRLTVLGRAERVGNKIQHWYCMCDCGKYTVVSGVVLRSGKQVSCGCYQREQASKSIAARNRVGLMNQNPQIKIKDESGKRYGRLVVIEQAPRNPKKPVRWLCKCDCGKSTVVQGCDLRSGRTKSCGCLQKEKVREKVAEMNRRKRAQAK